MRATAAAARSERGKSLSDRVLRQFGDAVDLQLQHDLAPVGLDRLGADLQDGGDLLRALPFGQQLQDLPLPAAQRRLRARRRLAGRCRTKLLDQDPGDARAETNDWPSRTARMARVSSSNAPSFRRYPVAPGLEHLPHEAAVGVDRERDDLHLRVDAP